MVALQRARWGLKRRRFLQGGLTLVGLGLTGCAKGTKSRKSKRVLGERRDPSFQHGHRLWEGSLPQEPTLVERCGAVVLGGGIAGLSAGWRWSRAGFEDYRLLELEPDLGGNSRSLRNTKISVPIGAHYLPVPNREARAVRRLLREMKFLSPNGEIDGRHLCHSRKERLFYNGGWHDGLFPGESLSLEAREQHAEFVKHMDYWRSKKDKSGRPVFALPLHFSSREEEFLSLDKISFQEYIEQQGWTDPFLLWYIEYACRDDFGCSVAACSAWAGLHNLSLIHISEPTRPY